MAHNNTSNHFLINDVYLTDGGLETTLLFHERLHLPHFAAFHLLTRPEHRNIIDAYYRQYLELAKRFGTGFILESPTWRSNPDWGYKLGYSQIELVKANQIAIEQMKSLRIEYSDKIGSILISGCVGPRHDGYVAALSGNWEDAKIYHSRQIKTLRDSGVDLVSGLTMTNVQEALGIVMAAKDLRVPAVVSFTVEVDGLLPDGKSLFEAVKAIDQASEDYPLYYMINCAHPEHFADCLSELDELVYRIQGIRANASCKSHAELDEATELDMGNKKELAQWYGSLRSRHPHIKIFGGCCGTDISHMEEICTTVISDHNSQ
ncbi:homocysteine S-methyltransferase family protein [Maribacter sp. 2307UL18-2]|uniref:homocysteine S-methyltransferase family protein n=1 Tax=Maribacter sp. 2307UL18-2 TaxID=3386274 RepID=UPI0039BD6C1C